MEAFYCLIVFVHFFRCFSGVEVLPTHELNQQKYQGGKYDVLSYQKTEFFMWKEFKNKYNRIYESWEEYERFKIFKQNLDIIAKHNNLYERGQSSYTLGVNEYADMDREEFVKIMNGYNPTKSVKPSGAIDHIQYLSPLVKMDIPDEVDWRKSGYVTPIKNQGACGSCWAFSSTGSLEGQHFRKTKKLTSLSEQNLVDCTRKWGNMGCEGGWMDNAFKYIKDNHGIDTEDGYPYEAEQEKCHFKTSDVGATDKGFVDIVPRGDETKLKEAVASVGPISIAIDASHSSFQLYKDGVYDEVECHNNVTSLDHAVLIVGYGSKGSKDYWLVKNSWGNTWGDKGYIYMSRNKQNQCGVATRASYPLV